METDDARTAVLEAADELFYARGVQAVGMDAVRTAAGIPLKRMYALFPSKADNILTAFSVSLSEKGGEVFFTGEVDSWIKGEDRGNLMTSFKSGFEKDTNSTRVGSQGRKRVVEKQFFPSRSGRTSVRTPTARVEVYSET